MSRRAVTLGLKGINRICRRGRTNVRLQPVASDDVNRAIEQAGDIFFQPDIIEHGDTGAWIDIDDYVQIAARLTALTCNRAEHRHMADAAGAQVFLMPA